jgi:alkylation response protein AidB-like acyl-CoA dehydrogenase
LNGRKQWCTNGSFAGLVMAMFRTGGAGPAGVSAFLVDPAAAGVQIEKVTEKLGIHTSNTADLRFSDVRVRHDALLGREGDGLSSALLTLTAGRVGIAAQAVGILAACLDASIKFAKERSAFGRPIGAFEGISFKIARMATDLEAARLLVYRAAALADAGKPFAVEASQAKLFASTAARVHASEAVQIHGGYGYTTEFPVERYYRDAKITEIYEGCELLHNAWPFTVRRPHEAATSVDVEMRMFGKHRDVRGRRAFCAKLRGSTSSSDRFFVRGESNRREMEGFPS